MRATRKKVVVGILAGTLLLCCGTSLAIGASDKPPKRDLEPLPAVSTTEQSTPAATRPATPAATRPATPAATRPAAPPAQRSSSPPRRSVYYANCTAARAAGAAPLYRGDPGYRPALDRDGDGIACER